MLKSVFWHGKGNVERISERRKSSAKHSNAGASERLESVLGWLPPSVLTVRLFSKSINRVAEKWNPCIEVNVPLRHSGFCAIELGVHLYRRQAVAWCDFEGMGVAFFAQKKFFLHTYAFF